MLRNVGLWMSLLFMAIAGGLFWQSLSLAYETPFGPGPGFFPRWLSGAMLLLSLGYGVSSLRSSKVSWSEVMPKGQDLRNVAALLGASLAFLLLLTQIGFVVTGTLVLAYLLLRSYSWRRSSLIGLLTCLLIYAVFGKWLDVPLPTGDLWNGIG